SPWNLLIIPPCAPTTSPTASKNRLSVASSSWGGRSWASALDPMMSTNSALAERTSPPKLSSCSSAWRATSAPTWWPNSSLSRARRAGHADADDRQPPPQHAEARRARRRRRHRHAVERTEGVLDEQQRQQPRPQAADGTAEQKAHEDEAEVVEAQAQHTEHRQPDCPIERWDRRLAPGQLVHRPA